MKSSPVERKDNHENNHQRAGSESVIGGTEMNAEQRQRASQLVRSQTEEEAIGEAFALLQELIDAPEPEPVGYTNETELDYVRKYEALPVSGAFWPTSDEDACVALYTAPPATANPARTGSSQIEPPADLVRDAERWLSEHDLELLVTFGIQADDCDADGHTLSKEQTRRLCELGVLRHVGFGRHEMTAFGDSIFGVHFSQGISLPLHTHAEYNAAIERNKQKGGEA